MDITHAELLATVSARTDRCEARIDKLEKRQDNLETLVNTVHELAVRQTTVESDVKEVKADIKVLTGKSGKKWEALVEKVTWAVIAAALGFLLAQIGL